MRSESGVLTIRSAHDVLSFINEREQSSSVSRWMLIAVLGSFFVDGYALTAFGIAVPTASKFFHLTPVELGALSSSLAIGAMVAGLIGGYFVDRIGRLRLFVLDLFLFVISAIIGSLTSSYTILLLCRLAAGIGVGLDVPAAYSFIVEFRAVSQKRRTANRYLVWLYYSMLFSYGVAIVAFSAGAGPNLWRWIVGVGAVPALIFLIMRYFFVEESAAWLACRGDLSAAARVLERMYDVKTTVAATVKHWTAPKLNYASLFQKKYLSRTVSAGVINILQSIEFFAIGFYIPTIAGQLFKNDPYIVALLGAAIMSVVGYIGSNLSSYTVQALGIRRQTLIGYFVQLVALVIIGLVGTGIAPTLAYALIGVFFISHTFGPGQNGVTMASLSYPTEIRGAGTGFSYGIGRAGSYIGTFFFPILLASVGLVHSLFWTAVVPLAGMLALLAIRWDPTGAEVELPEPALATE